MSLRRIIAVILAVVLCLSGCKTNSSSANTEDNHTAGSSGTSESTDTSVSDVFAENESEMFTDRDKKAAYDESAAVKITLNGASATATSDSVQISGATVKITQEATYVVSGTLTDGMLIVETDKKAKPHIVFSGASITSKTSAPLYIKQADKVVITLAEDTENALVNGGSFVAIDDNNIDGAVFSKQDLTFNGSGTLTVTAPAGHGIVCKDDLVFAGGVYQISAASHAIDANDSVRATETIIAADAGKDGIHAENEDDASLGFVYIGSGAYTIEAEGDGISAGSYLQIDGGEFDITAGGGSENGAKQSSGYYGDFMGGGGMGGGFSGGMGSRPKNTVSSQTDTDSTSMKGLKATGNLQITGGTFRIDSADDAVHTNASMYIQGGSFDAATGDDGFHAEETLEISGGEINISESYEGIEALHIKISGGNTTLKASDDGLNAAGGTDQSGFGGRDDGGFGGRGPMGGGMSQGNGSIVISGGALDITASGDGLDANGTLEITGGYTIVCGPTQGDTATLDYDKTATISGGTFIGTGAAGGMAQTFSESPQGVIAVKVGNVSANTELILKDSSGKTLLSHKPSLDYAVVILSSPEMEKGKTYTITVGTKSAEFEAS